MTITEPQGAIYPKYGHAKVFLIETHRSKVNFDGTLVVNKYQREQYIWASKEKSFVNKFETSLSLI